MRNKTVMQAHLDKSIYCVSGLSSMREDVLIDKNQDSKILSGKGSLKNHQSKLIIVNNCWLMWVNQYRKNSPLNLGKNLTLFQYMI